MPDINLDLLRKELEYDEGRRHKPYEDTMGKLTIGVGRNLFDRPLSDAEINVLLDNDIKIVLKELDKHLPWWRELSEPAQRALANMCFNLGMPRLLKFQNMIVALRDGDMERAAEEALDSVWATQVHSRADRIAKRFTE